MMNFDLFKPFSLFSEPNSDENKKIPDSISDLKDEISLNQSFLEEAGEKEFWISQLSPTLSGSRHQSTFELDSDFGPPIINSSPSPMFSHKVEVIALYRTSKKDIKGHELVLKNRRPEIFKQRKNFSEDSSKILKNWLLDHRENPYPSPDQINALCKQTGLTSKQIRTYFVNNRSRLLFRSPKGGKVKKSRKTIKEEQTQLAENEDNVEQNHKIDQTIKINDNGVDSLADLL